jgi:hypothetical protein
MTTNLNSIKSRTKQVLNDLYNIDEFLFKVNEGRGASERCIVFRLAMYLQQNFPSYYVDCDFNSSFSYYLDENGKYIGRENSGKPIKNPDGSSTARFVDIIIHKRNFTGHNGSLPNNDFICFEIKKNDNYDGRNKDLNNLKELTSNYGYLYGFHLILGKHKDKCKWTIFQNGEIIEEKVSVFEDCESN